MKNFVSDESILTLKVFVAFIAKFKVAKGFTIRKMSKLWHQRPRLDILSNHHNSTKHVLLIKITTNIILQSSPKLSDFRFAHFHQFINYLKELTPSHNQFIRMQLLDRTRSYSHRRNKRLQQGFYNIISICIFELLQVVYRI